MRLSARGWADSIRSGETGVKADDGGTPRPAGRALLRVLARTACAGEALAALDRQGCRTRRAAAGIGSVLQRDGAAIDRSGAAYPDADRRLLLRYPLGAAAVRGGAPQSGVPLVLRIGPR